MSVAEPPTGCLTDSEILELVHGKLAKATRAVMDRHLSGCRSCRERVAAAARAAAPGGEPTTDPGAEETSAITDPTSASAVASELGGADTQLRPPGSDPVPRHLSNSAPVALWPPGTRIDRYLLQDPIGAGGMGVVYEALDPQLNRKVALKLVRAELGGRGHKDSAGFRSRLLREAQALARLSHPNVVSVHDLGAFENQLFIAMEFVDGTSVTKWLKERPRTWREVLDVYLLAGQGLAAAHAAGLVHRDFKPDNVMVGRDGRVRVLDLGLARASSADTDSAARPALTPPESRAVLDELLTQEGDLVGTPAYMAPEQARRGRADELSDQFSFCVSLWEGIYGARPYHSADLLQSSSDGALALVEPPRGTKVPRWLRRILLRGLSPAARDRYSSLNALLAAIRRARRRVVQGAVAAGVALLVVLGALGLYEQATVRAHLKCREGAQRLNAVWNAGQADRVHQAFAASRTPYAETSFEQVRRTLDGYAAGWSSAYEEVCRAALTADTAAEARFAARLHCLDGLRGDVGALVRVFEQADRSTVEEGLAAARGLMPVSQCTSLESLQARALAPSDPAVRAQVEAAEAQLAETRALRSAGRPQEALARATTVSEEARTIGFGPLTARALRTEGELRQSTGDVRGAAGLLKEALLISEAAGDGRATAETWASLAYGAFLQHDIERGLEHCLHAEAVLSRLTGCGDIEARVHRMRGLLLEAQGRLDEALVEHQQALGLDERLFGRDHTRTLHDLSNLGDLYRRTGQYGRALQLQTDAVAQREKAFGLDNPSLGPAYTGLGETHRRLGQYPQALEAHRKAVALIEKSQSANSSQLATCLDGLVATLLDTGELAEALAQASRAADIQLAALGPKNPRTATAFARQGEVALASGHPDSALLLHRRAEDIDRAASETDNPALARDLAFEGRDLLALGRAKEAMVPLEQALAGLKADRSATAEVKFALATALRATDPASPRAVALATEARDAWHAEGTPPAAKKAEQAERWLSQKAAPQSPVRRAR